MIALSPVLGWSYVGIFVVALVGLAVLTMRPMTRPRYPESLDSDFPWVGSDPMSEVSAAGYSTVGSTKPVGDALDMFLSPWHPSMVGHHDALRAHLALAILAERPCHHFTGYSTCIDIAFAAQFDVPPFEGMSWKDSQRARYRDPRNWCPGCIARQGLGPAQQTKEDDHGPAD